MASCEYEYDPETQTLRMDCMGCFFGPSIEDFDVCMAKTIDKLMEIKKAPRIILSEMREYEYDYKEVGMLLEIAIVVDGILREKIISFPNIIVKGCESCSPPRYAFLNYFMNEIKYDPIKAYKKLLKEMRNTKVKIGKEEHPKNKCYENYFLSTLLPIRKMLEGCKLIQLGKDDITKHEDRALYRQIFHPTVRPNFMYTRYVVTPPAEAELLERYKTRESTVEIYRLPGKTRKLYHIIPPEFRLVDEEFFLLDTARRYIGRHEPREGESIEPGKIRENLYRIGIDLMADIARTNNINVNETRLKKLGNILTRYTAGLGILELMLDDERVQDIAVNSPMGKSPIFIFHRDYLECETNMVPSIEDAESWATRFRLQSGRPLDEANPVLDTELSVPGGRARVAAITRSLSPDGLAFAFRRHRDNPWTFPLFIDGRMIDPFSAGLLWFIIDGSRSLLIAGTRSSGKTSFLGSCMVQMIPKLRIITVEDTLELPVEKLREIGYNTERLKARSVITHVETELSAEEALRTALRLGDSVLIVGEVRSKEALALYEAMRIGALANVVAGTIHGESAYGVFDRVVNDLGVPATSFKATDIVLVCSMLKSPDGLKSFRRVIEFTEVRKHWKDDPQEEGGFVNLMEYSAKDDVLKPTKTLLMGESVILNDIASRVREWKGNWAAMWDNIQLRAKVLETLVDTAKKSNNMDIMEANFVSKSNSMFHLISEGVKDEVGSLDSKMIYNKWYGWLKEQVK